MDASVAFRNWKEGKDNKYEEIISKQVRSNLSEFLKILKNSRLQIVKKKRYEMVFAYQRLKANTVLGQSRTAQITT